MDDFKSLEKVKNKFSLPKIIMRQVLFDNSDSVIDYFQKKDLDQDHKPVENSKLIKENEHIIKKQMKKSLEQSF